MYSDNVEKYRTLLSGLDRRNLWLKSFLLDVSQPSVCSLFRSGLSGSQMNSLSGGTAYYTHIVALF